MSDYADFILRLADKEDCKSITACVNAAYQVTAERIGRQPAPMLADYSSLISRSQVYILSIGSGVHGVLVLEEAGDVLLIENIAVHPKCQGQGIGRMLLAFAEREARARHSQALQLYTNEAMVENIAFYQRAGYREVDRRMEDGYRRVFMQKTSPPSAGLSPE